MMPLAGEELVYEMMASGLLMPGCDGVPIWDGKEKGEKQVIKCPLQFRNYFKERNRDKQLDEDAGEFMARWAKGEVSKPKEPAEPQDTSKFIKAIERVQAATNEDELEAAVEDSRKIKGWSKSAISQMKEAIDAQRELLKQERQPGDE